MTERICSVLPSLALREDGHPTWHKENPGPRSQDLHGKGSCKGGGQLVFGAEVQLQTALELGPRGEVYPFLVVIILPSV